MLVSAEMLPSPTRSPAIERSRFDKYLVIAIKRFPALWRHSIAFANQLQQSIVQCDAKILLADARQTDVYLVGVMVLGNLVPGPHINGSVRILRLDWAAD